MHPAYRSHLAMVVFTCWCVSGSTAAAAEPHALADLDGSRQRARIHYRQSKNLCDDARDRRCEQAADYYLDYPFAGP